MCATLFSFYLSRNCRHSETQIWLTNSFFFVCCGDFFDLGKFFVSIGKNQIFFLALFFSLFRCCFFWPFIARYFFFARKKAKFPLRCHTLSFLIFSKKLIWFFLSFSWLDWGHSTASNQLQIFLKIFFFHENKGSFVVTFLFLAFFSLSANTYWVWNKSSDFFCTIFENQKFLKELFDHEICLTLFQQPEKRLIFSTGPFIEILQKK